MAQAKVFISRSITNGPFIMRYELDGVVQDAKIQVASLSAAITQAQTWIGSAVGTIDNTTIVTNLS